MADKEKFPEDNWLKVGTGEKTGFFADFQIPGTRMWRSPEIRARFERETGQTDETTEAYHSGLGHLHTLAPRE